VQPKIGRVSEKVEMLRSSGRLSQAVERILTGTVAAAAFHQQYPMQ
jgi:hypothetical protein